MIVLKVGGYHEIQVSVSSCSARRFDERLRHFTRGEGRGWLDPRFRNQHRGGHQCHHASRTTSPQRRVRLRAPGWRCPGGSPRRSGQKCGADLQEL